LKNLDIPIKPVVLDLFSGCGGLSYGFHKSNYDVKLAIDNNQKALETYKYNHQNTNIICDDIVNISHKEIIRNAGNEIDVIIGGPPCQGLSLAGLRNFDDPRNRLFRSYLKITNMVKPRAFVFENVPGLLSLYKGKIKEILLEEFHKMGYNVSYTILNAADYGVPQFRRRVFFVGIQDGNFLFPNPTHVADSTLFSDLQNYVTCKDALSDLPSLVDSEGTEKQCYSQLFSNKYQELMRRNSDIIHNHIATLHQEHVVKIIKMVPEGGNYKNLPEEFRYTRKFNVAWSRYHSKKPAATIDTGHRHHFHYEYNRVPTVRENARLQSFPDKFVFLGNKTDQYKQVGNAVPPLLAEAIAKQLLNYL